MGMQARVIIFSFWFAFLLPPLGDEQPEADATGEDQVSLGASNRPASHGLYGHSVARGCGC